MYRSPEGLLPGIVATAAIGLIAFPIPQPTWVFVK